VRKTQFGILMLVGFAAGISPAASSAIGIAMANGNFEIDNAKVRGNSTVFEGSSIATEAAGSELHLSNGVRMRLGAEAAGRIYSDRFVLEKGAGQVESGTSFRIEAGTLRVVPESPACAVRVAVTPEGRVRIAAVRGRAHVSRQDGMLLARVAPQQPVEVEASDTSDAAKLAGLIEHKDGAYLLTDTTSGVRVQLVGSGLAENVGKHVVVRGAIESGMQAVAGASQVVRVISVTPAAAASGGAAAAAVTGMSVATKAVIGGAVVAATGGIATGVLVTRDEPTQTISR